MSACPNCSGFANASKGENIRRFDARAEFTDAVRNLRQERGISLREMAKLCGVSAGFLSDFELGRRWSDVLVRKLLVVLK